jgi:hypothetical protein
MFLSCQLVRQRTQNIRNAQRPGGNGLFDAHQKLNGRSSIDHGCDCTQSIGIGRPPRCQHKPRTPRANPAGTLNESYNLFSPCEMHLPQVVEWKRLLLAFAASASRIRLWAVCRSSYSCKAATRRKNIQPYHQSAPSTARGRVRKERRLAPVTEFIGNELCSYHRKQQPSSNSKEAVTESVNSIMGLLLHL